MRMGSCHSALRLIFTGVVAGIVAFSLAFSLGVSGHTTSSDPLVPPTLTDQERAVLFSSGATWSGQGTQGVSQDFAENFTDYPIFWLGESFANYNLQAIIHEKYTPPDPIPAFEAMDAVGFGYGDCTIPEGSSACPVPVLIKTEPACLTRPETVADSMRASSLETVRGGALMLRFTDGHIRLWTGEVSIYISAPVDPTIADQMVHALHGINHETPAASFLAPPDFSQCPPVDSRLRTAPPSS